MKTLAFDVESDGLWGLPFAIGAIVLIDGKESTRFFGRLCDSAASNEWVKENVLPELRAEPVTHWSIEELLADFADFYLTHKHDANIVTHMGYIVEAELLRQLRERNFIGEWDAPYPLFDVSGNLQQAGEDPTSVDAYVSKHRLYVGEFNGGAHHPLYDAAATAAVYNHLLLKRV